MANWRTRTRFMRKCCQWIARMTQRLNIGATIFSLSAQYKKALDDANAWLAASPIRDAYFFRGRVLISLGQSEAAVTDLDRCIKPTGFPDFIDPSAVVTRAIARLLAGHSHDARADAYLHLTMVPQSIRSTRAVLGGRCRVRACQ